MSPSTWMQAKGATTKPLPGTWSDTGMYEAVYTTDRTTPARYAITAKTYGFDGVIFMFSADESRSSLHDNRVVADIDLKGAVTIAAETKSAASRSISQARHETAVVCFQAETVELQRFGATQTHVDVLMWPIEAGPLDPAIARTAKEHGVYPALNLGAVLRTRGETRSSAIDAIRETAKRCRKYDVPVVVSGFPRSHLELRSPRDLQSVGSAIGLPDPIVTEGMKAWGDILQRTERARSDTFIEPGVQHHTNEPDDR